MACSWLCYGGGVLVKNFVDRVVESELDVLAEGQPGQDLRFLRRQFEILPGVELNSHPLGISEFLYRRIDPLAAVLVKAAAGHETGLLRGLRHPPDLTLLSDTRSGNR